ncbi:hypothetical protein D3C75_1167620 [compost metagenome]
MGQVQIDHVLPVDAQLQIHTDMENFAGGNIPGHQIAVGGIFFLQEVPGFAVLIGPDPAALATGGFAHQPQLVVPGNGRGVDLDELPVGEMDTLLVHGRCRGAGVDHGVGGFPEDNARSARS